MFLLNKKIISIKKLIVSGFVNFLLMFTDWFYPVYFVLENKMLIGINRFFNRLLSFSQIVILCLYSSIVLGQSSIEIKKIEQLEREFAGSQSDSTKVNLLLKLSEMKRKFDLSKSIANDQEALFIAKQAGDPNLIARAANSLGTSCMNAGLYDMAVDYYSQMERVGKELQDPQIMGKAKFNLATVKVILDDFQGANTDLALAVDKLNAYYLGLGTEVPTHMRLSFENNLGVNSKGLENYDEAKLHFRRGIGLAREKKATKSPVYFQLINNYGELLVSENRLDSADFLFQESLVGLDSLPDDRMRVLSVFNIGKLRQVEGKHLEAISFLKEGFRLSQAVQNFSALKHISESLKKSYEFLSVPDSALRYSNFQKEFDSKLGIQEASAELLKADLLAQFEMEQQLLEEKYTKGSRVHFIFLFISLLISALLIFLYIKWKGKYNLMNTMKLRIEKHAEKLDAINKDLEGEILKRDKDLTLMAMSSIQQAELVDTVSEKLKTKSSEGFVNDFELEKILIELKNSKTKKVWEEFELRFKNLDSKFYDQLRYDFPSLTMNERRLSAFLKLQMTTKEIVSLTGQSIRAVELARTRLRKKLNLTNSELSLYDFLLNYGK